MKRYEKPAISVINLQLRENIAAVPTTVFKGSKASMPSAGSLVSMALTEKATGIKTADSEDLIELIS